MDTAGNYNKFVINNTNDISAICIALDESRKLFDDMINKILNDIPHSMCEELEMFMMDAQTQRNNCEVALVMARKLKLNFEH